MAEDSTSSMQLVIDSLLEQNQVLHEQLMSVYRLQHKDLVQERIRARVPKQVAVVTENPGGATPPPEVMNEMVRSVFTP